MSPVSAELKIHVYLVDGSVRKFVQRDPEKITKILSEIQPRKLFGEKFLKLAEPAFMAIFPCISIVRVDFVMPSYPEWSATEMLEIIEITPETFRMKCRAERGQAPPEMTRKVGQPFSGYCEFDLTNGQRIPVEIRTVVPAHAELGVMLSHLMETSTVVVKRINGGVTFVNMRHAIRFRLHPQNPALLKAAWPVNRVTDREEFEKYEGSYS